MMFLGQGVECELALLRQGDKDLAAVLFSPRPAHQSARIRAGYQFRRAVLVDLETLRQRANRHQPAGITLDHQQELMVLWLQTDLAGSVFAEPQEPPKLITKFRQRLIPVRRQPLAHHITPFISHHDAFHQMVTPHLPVFRVSHMVFGHKNADPSLFASSGTGTLLYDLSLNWSRTTLSGLPRHQVRHAASRHNQRVRPPKASLVTIPDTTLAPIQPKRVVITGIGAISSLAPSADETWQRILANQTGIDRAENLDPALHSCLLRGDVDDSGVRSRFLAGKQARNTSRFSKMAIEAAGDALEDAGLLDDELKPVIDLTDAGAALGTCVGGTYDDLLPAYETALKRESFSRVPPHLHVMFPHNLAAYTIQHQFGMQGPSSTVVTACATGSQAIGDGFHAIKYGHAPLMIAGASESTRHPMFQAGFAAMRALVTDSNDDPDKASRPFDATRAGFVLGEGAGMLVLEELEHALARNATIYAEIAGYATSNDAYHPIAPQPDGIGAARAISAALADAGIDPSEVNHINAHAASTPAGDLAEAKAIYRVFGERAATIPVTSIKGAIGHCMASAGALETIASALTIRDGLIPPTRNYCNPDPEIGLDIVHGTAREADVSVMTKHSFGLGGQNACLVLRRYDRGA